MRGFACIFAGLLGLILSEQQAVAGQPFAAPFWVSEIKIGGLAHGEGFLSNSGERGTDISLDVLFKEPQWKAWNHIYQPRPFIGASFNLNGYTDQLYGGLAWQWQNNRHIFWGGGFGLAVHDGELIKKYPGQKDRALGSRVLFRSEVEVGYYFHQNHNISFALSHISHAGLFNDENEGLDTFGIKYGYKF